MATDTLAAPARTATAGPPAWRRLLGSWDAILVVALVVVVLVATATIDGVGSPRFYRFLALEAIPIALIALPMTLVIITGEIDLSVASTVGLTCSVLGHLWHLGVTSLPLLIVSSLLLGAVLGAVNGVFVTMFGLPSLAVTIGTLALYRGLAYVVLGDRAVADYPPAWTQRAVAPIPGTVIPWFVLVLAALAVAFGVLLYATPVGRALYAIGNNAEASVFTGISVRRTKFWLFVATGAMAALAGVFWTFRFASARADNATGLELAVVAAVLLGGVSIFGGRGGLVGVLAAVALLGVLRNALQLANVPANTLTIVTGTLLILSVVGPNLVRMTRERLRRRRPPATAPERNPS
ncbi:ABC transporter permease [Micromonospora sp. WMMD1082]|uniref:ABC transporter permease n=1 Tax=Micromonospora sp. WMMD1082 TaxID=3016104 RepID=UPI002416EAED|nr:ABC transporter permease [Micromonospora sp. WMMD1082]MDG4798264.1 ABC transporter permease [Micromonospora sp. WMMD1082]